MQIHEVLTKYLDLTEAALASAEEIEAYNILRIFAEKLKPEFNIGDRVRDIEDDKAWTGYVIATRGLDLSNHHIYYESDNLDYAYRGEDLELVEKSDSIENPPKFKVGDQALIYKPSGSQKVTNEKIKVTVYQIVDDVYYLRTADGKIITKLRDLVFHDTSRY